VLQGACCKYRTQKVVKKSPSGHHRTTLSGYIFATKAHIDNISSTRSHNLVNFGPLAAEMSGSLGHPCKFQRVSRLGSVTIRHSSIGVSQTAAFTRGRHLYLAGRPSRWALAHIGSRPSDHYFCSVCLSVCLCRVYLSRL